MKKFPTTYILFNTDGYPCAVTPDFQEAHSWLKDPSNEGKRLAVFTHQFIAELTNLPTK